MSVKNTTGGGGREMELLSAIASQPERLDTSEMYNTAVETML